MPYRRTSVEMPYVVAFARTLVGKYPTGAIVMAYAMFRNESANGTRGVCNNYGGVQADLVRWTDLPGKPVGTCVKLDSGGKDRRFLCFNEDGYKVCFELMCVKATERRMKTTDDYFKKWVGKNNYTKAEAANFDSLLRSGKVALVGLPRGRRKKPNV